MNEEALIVAALLSGVPISALSKYGISSKEFTLYKDELHYIERHGIPSKKFFKRKFPDFKLRKIDPNDFEHIVTEWRTKRTRHRLANELQVVLDKFDTEDPIKIAQRLYEVGRNVVAKSEKVSVSNIISDWKPLYDSVEEKIRLKREGKFLGIPTGIPTIDRSMNGLMPQELIVVLGFQSEGKSWLLSDFATSALVHDKRVLFVSLEMARDRVAYRIHTMLSATVSGKREGTFPNLSIESGDNLDLNNYQKFLREMSQKYRKGLFVVDNGVRSMAQLKGLVDDIRPDVVFWDYLGLNVGADKNGQEWQRVGDEADLAKQVAKEYNIPVVVAAQANRSGNNDRDNPPSLASVAKSYLIGAHADRVLSLRSNKKELILELIKNRYGPSVRVVCDWDVNIGVVREQTLKLPKGNKKLKK